MGITRTLIRPILPVAAHDHFDLFAEQPEIGDPEGLDMENLTLRFVSNPCDRLFAQLDKQLPQLVLAAQDSILLLNCAPELIFPRQLHDGMGGRPSQQLEEEGAIMLGQLDPQAPLHHLDPDLIPIHPRLILLAAILLRLQLRRHGVRRIEDLPLPVRLMREAESLIECLGRLDLDLTDTERELV